MAEETVLDRYRRLAARFARLVAGVPDGAWSDPTPCSDWDVRALVGHVVDSQSLFLGLVGRPAVDGPAPADDPVGAWAAASGAVEAVLADPDAAATEFDGFFGRTRFDTAVERFVCFDLVVHGWDLARATGQDQTIGEDDLAFLEATMPLFGDALHGPGVCGPVVEVPADAGHQARVLAELGRG